MFEHRSGSIFDTEAEALVNPVNCEGVMGAGLAFQFKQKYPENFLAYWSVCRAGMLRPGKVLVLRIKDQYIVNFPTKDQWRNDAKIEYIESGLVDLRSEMSDRRINSIAFPKLGCGLGNLRWSTVLPLIENAMKDYDGQVLIYDLSN